MKKEMNIDVAEKIYSAIEEYENQLKKIATPSVFIGMGVLFLGMGFIVAIAGVIAWLTKDNVGPSGILFASGIFVSIALCHFLLSFILRINYFKKRTERKKKVAFDILKEKIISLTGIDFNSNKDIVQLIKKSNQTDIRNKFVLLSTKLIDILKLMHVTVSVTVKTTQETEVICGDESDSFTLNWQHN